jgi:hemerythrin
MMGFGHGRAFADGDGLAPDQRTRRTCGYATEPSTALESIVESNFGYFQLDRSHMTGYADIDAQHQTMAKMLFDLAGAAERREGAGRCLQLFDAYVAYTRVHFQHEEQLMIEFGFSSLDAHREKHERLLNQLSSLRNAFADDDPKTIASDAFEWLVVHIERNDCELGSFLSQHRNAHGGEGASTAR